MATDTFDGSGTLSGSWTDYISSSTAKLTQSGGNVVPSIGAESTGFYYAGAASGNNQYSEITINGSLGSAQTYWVACVRVQGDNATRDMYQLTVTSDHWYLTKQVNGSNVWETDGAGTFGSGSVIRIEAIDSGANVVVTAYENDVEFATNTDTTSVITGGQPGLGVYAHTSFLTPVSVWSGGDVGSTQSNAPRAMHHFTQQGI